MTPILLDLFCGAGGAAKGYQRAGFYVVGVDQEPQPNYCGDEFVQADAFEYLAGHYRNYDTLHGSPPCQAYSIMRNLPWLEGREYPALILPLRDAFTATGKPWVIENVMGAKKGGKHLEKFGLEAHGMAGAYLCGTMFGLPFYRHRLFEANWLWWVPGGHKRHRKALMDLPMGKGRGTRRESGFRHPNPVNTNWRASHDGGNGAQGAGVGLGHAAGWKLAAAAMGIGWMKRAELTQAIPPVFTEWIGQQLIHQVQER